MSVISQHSQAMIIRQVLIDLGLGIDSVATVGGSWPVFDGDEPGMPDNCLTVFDTQGRDFGSHQIDGERLEYHGIQVRIRAADSVIGWQKKRAIELALDRLYCHGLVIDGTTYCVRSVNRTSSVSLGKEESARGRRLFTINAVVNVTVID